MTPIVPELGGTGNTDAGTAVDVNPDARLSVISAAEGMQIRDIILECSPEDASNRALDAIEMIATVVDVNAAKHQDDVALLSKTSPTIWKYNYNLELHSNMNALLIDFRSKGAIDLGYVTLTRNEIEKYMAIKDTEEFSYKAITDWNAPSLRLKFIVGRSHAEPNPSRGSKAGCKTSGPNLKNAPSAIKHNRIGDRFLSRYIHTGELDDMSSAIEHMRRAVLLTPDDDVDLPTYLNILGTWLSRRFDRTDNYVDQSDATEYLEKSVLLTPEDDSYLPLFLSNLGLLYAHRFDKTAHLEDISTTINHELRAVLLTPEDDPDLSLRLCNLGLSFSRRFEQTSDVADISDAIKYQQKAVLLTPENDGDMPSRLDNLGTSFLRRFQQTDILSDISNAIEQLQKAALLSPKGHTELPSFLNHLGLSFSQRFGRTSDLTDITNAIEHLERAVLLTPKGNEALPVRLANLGLALTRRFQVDMAAGLVDISTAIKHHKRAIMLTPKNSADRPMYMAHLGGALVQRFRRDRDLDDISDAIVYYEKAVHLTRENHATKALHRNNLGESFFMRYQQTTELDDTHTAIENFRLAANQSSASPAVRLNAARRWVRCAIGLKDPAQAIQAFGLAVELLSLVASVDQTIQNRQATLVNISGVVNAAVVYAFMTGSTGIALEWLEQGRCLVWTQLNQLRTPVDMLREYDAALADRFLAVSKDLESSGSRTESPGWSTNLKPTITQQIQVEDQVRTHVQLAQEWSQLLAKIRNTPNFHDFLRPPKAAHILSQLPLEGFVVVINLHDERCDALALLTNTKEPVHIPLKELTYKRADELRLNLFRHLVSNGLRTRDARGVRRPVKSTLAVQVQPIRQILHDLWVRVVRPILEHLQYTSPPSHSSRPHIRWCATGPLAFLPIHAAGIYGREGNPSGLCLSDFAVSSYVPTVSILVEKLKNSTTIKRPKTKLLLLSQPNTPGLPPIPATTKETKTIAKRMQENDFEVTLLESGEATTNRVKEEIKTHGWVHFACHASQDATDPLKSGFALHNGSLELMDLITQQVPIAEFAFLSACQTSVGDEKLPEEAAHLAAGMLSAGYQGVVATMWSIKDDTAPDIADDFYSSLWDGRKDRDDHRLDSRRAAYALDYATRRIRDRFGTEEDALLKWVPYIHYGL